MWICYTESPSGRSPRQEEDEGVKYQSPDPLELVLRRSEGVGRDPWPRVMYLLWPPPGPRKALEDVFVTCLSGVLFIFCVRVLRWFLVFVLIIWGIWLFFSFRGCVFWRCSRCYFFLHFGYAVVHLHSAFVFPNGVLVII